MFKKIIYYLKNLFSNNQIYELRDVFTPSSSAKISYIRRENLEKKIIRSMDIKGKQLVVYGHSGSGKTTILNHVLSVKCQKSIVSRCNNTSTIDKIILDAFDELNSYYIESYSSTKKDSVTGGMASEYLTLKASISSTFENSETEIAKRILPPQLTMQRLGRFIGEAKAIWIIEDFHKVPDEEKINISQMMKLFMDLANEYPNLKIVILGAAEKGSDVVAHDPELSNRISEVEIPLLNESEIESILKKGAEVLNVQFETELIHSVAKTSNYLATIAHQLAYNLCTNHEIKHTHQTFVLIKKSELDKAIEDFSSDKQNTYKALYNDATKQRSGKWKNIEIILKTLSSLGNENITQHDLLLAIQENYEGYPPSNLSSYLKKLTDPNDGVEILRNNSGRISFSDPFFKSYVSMQTKSKNNS